MRTISFILLFTLTLGCKKVITPEQQAVETSRVAFQESPSKITAQALIKTMNDYVLVYGYQDSTSARYTLEAARLAAAFGPPVQARKLYTSYLVNYPDRPGQADLLAEYITVSEKLNLPKLNDVLYKSFANRFPDDNRSAVYKEKVQIRDITADSLVRQIGLTMFNDSTFRLEEKTAKLYIELCQDLVMTNPTHPKAPEFLHHGAETARTLRDVHKAIELYDWIIDQYPANPRAATSLFLKAFTLDNDLQQFAEAEKYYNRFLELYPESEFAESAQFLLDNLGVSEEELKKKIDENAAKNLQ